MMPFHLFAIGEETKDGKVPLPRLVAEFEPQRAIVLSVSDLQPHHRHVLKQIIEKSHGHVEILILYNSQDQLKETVNWLNTKQISKADHVSFHQFELDTIWLRDFGPKIMEDPSKTRSLDFYYYGVRPYDDSFPERWSLNTNGTMLKIPWTLQGGNLLANGHGLCVTTSKIFDDNKISFAGKRSSLGNYDGRRLLVKELKQFCNLTELAVLEPLRFESTGHVDMFATFLAPDQILVAKVDKNTDRVNAQILDRNVQRLKQLTVNGKPLRVERIAIPPRQGNAWSTYANCILTDRLVLIPVMNSDPANYIRAAKATFQRLLPQHHVDTIDISSMKNLQGALHCMSLNLPAFAPLPNGVLNWSAAQKLAERVTTRSRSSTNAKTAYSIDKQLRRIFKSSNSDYLLDAYAIQIQGDVISFLRANDKQIIRVKTTAVCEADRYWIQRNAQKIRDNGWKVYQFVRNTN